MADQEQTTAPAIADNFDFDNPEAWAALDSATQEAGTAEEKTAAPAGESSTAEPEAAAPAAPATTAATAAAPAASAATADAPADGEGGASPSTTETHEPVAGVATKDGRGVIPFAELQSTRRRAMLAEHRAKQLEAEKQRLAAELEAAKRGETPTAAAGLTDEELQQLADDFPGGEKVVKALQAQRAEIDRLSKAQATEQPVDIEAVVDQQLSLQEQIDQALASSRALGDWRASNPDAWDRALQFDQGLISDPKYAALDFPARFAKLEKLVAADMDLELPTASSQASPAVAHAPKPDAAKVAAKAQAAAAKASLPETLTDLPGTAPVAKSDEDLSERELYAKVSQLSETEILRAAGVPV